MTALYVATLVLVAGIASVITHSLCHDKGLKKEQAKDSYMQGWRDGLGHPRPQQLLRPGMRCTCISEKVFYEPGVTGPSHMLSWLQDEHGAILFVEQEGALPDNKLVAVKGKDGKIRLVSQDAVGELVDAIA